jgi:hypothetical protein
MIFTGLVPAADLVMRTLLGTLFTLFMTYMATSILAFLYYKMIKSREMKE